MKTIKEIIKYLGVAIASGAAVYVFSDNIKKTLGKTGKNGQHSGCRCHTKPTVLLIYDGNTCNCVECHCSDDNEEQKDLENDVSDTLTDSACGPFESTGCGNCHCDELGEYCGCGIEDYKRIFEKYSSKANIRYVNISDDDRSSKETVDRYIERFSVEYLPAVLILTSSDNLIAKLDVPHSREEIESFLYRNLR